MAGLQRGAFVIGSCRAGEGAHAAFCIGANRPIARCFGPCRLILAQQLHRFFRFTQAFQGDRPVKSELEVLRLKAGCACEPALSLMDIAAAHRQGSGAVYQSGIAFMLLDPLAHDIKRAAYIAGPLCRDCLAMELLGSARALHYRSLSHPVIAYRPAGANGGT